MKSILKYKDNLFYLCEFTINEIFTNLKLSNDIFYENIRSTSKEDGTWYKTKEYSIIALGEKE